MDAAVIDALLQRHRELDEYLRTRGELSMLFDAEVLFKRSFVVACGSYCEVELCRILGQFANRDGDARLATFVRTRALERRFHDMFDWTAANANKFWSFFGDEFKREVSTAICADSGAAESVKGFIELGQLRNITAHEFATASVDRTVDELERLFRKAQQFLNLVERLLCIGRLTQQ